MRRPFTLKAGWAALLGAVLLLPCAPAPALAQSTVAQMRDGTPLTVENFVCRGNESTSCEFILGHLYLSVGDPVDEREIREASLRLSWLRNFESVSIYLEKGSERGRANVVVEVHEASPITWEATLGLYTQAASVGPLMVARATHYNLFGEGKILDAHAATLIHVDGPVSRFHRIGVQYIDPHLFGTKRNFLVTGISQVDERREWDQGDLIDADQMSIDILYGRRLWSFSYITFGYRFRPLSDVYVQRRDDFGQFEIRQSVNSGGSIGSFGWNSEDDPYFPTQGSRLHLGWVQSFSGFDDVSFSYRKNWRPFGRGKGVWTLIYEADQALSVQYARPIASASRLGMRRGMWYAAPFLRPYYHKVDGGNVREAGLTAGVRLETRSFGIVHFYVFGSGVSVAGDN